MIQSQKYSKSNNLTVFMKKIKLLQVIVYF